MLVIFEPNAIVQPVCVTSEAELVVDSATVTTIPTMGNGCSNLRITM
jgi:hypothetical protein